MTTGKKLPSRVARVMFRPRARVAGHDLAEKERQEPGQPLPGPVPGALVHVLLGAGRHAENILRGLLLEDVDHVVR